MATLTGHAVNVATALATNTDTNILDRGSQHWNMPAMVRIATTAGTSASFAIMGSVDNVNWFALPYADIATPGTVAVTTISQNTAVASYKIIQAYTPWRYVKVTLSGVVGVNATIDVYSGE